MVVIDTSAWLFALRRDFHPDVKNRIEALLLESDVAVNGLIHLELLGGVRTEKEYRRLKSRLQALYYIESTEALWNDASYLAFGLRRKGVTVPFTDIFIAASAMIHDALLVHADAHFDLISEHVSLKTESLLPLIRTHP